MDLLLTCHRDPFHRSGGSERAVRIMARRFAQKHDVTVATALEEDLADEETIEGVRVRRFPQRGPGEVTAWAPGYRSFLRRDWDAFLLYGQGVWVSNQAVGLLDSMPARTLYFPVGFYNLERAHARPLHKRLFDKVYYRTLQRHLLETADVVNSLTLQGIDDIRALASPETIVRIPTGVHPEEYAEAPDLDPRERFDIPAEAPLLLYVGGVYPNKDLGLAADATRALAARTDPDPVLCLCGTGTEDLADPPLVRGLGFVSEEEKVALMHEADTFLLTSDFEGFGLVLLESLAAGTPIVSTPVGVAPEFAQRDAGRVAEPDAGALADALAEVVDRSYDRDRLQGIAREFHWDRVEEAILSVLAGADEIGHWV